MRSSRIFFGPTGPRFDFTRVLIGFDCTVQNALVNLGTDRGTDRVYPSRGTDLKVDAAVGRMVNLTWANHTANFAALRTLEFIQQTDNQTNAFKLQDFKLISTGFSGQRIKLNAQATSVIGETRGVIAAF